MSSTVFDRSWYVNAVSVHGWLAMVSESPSAANGVEGVQVPHSCPRCRVGELIATSCWVLVSASRSLARVSDLLYDDPQVAAGVWS